MRSRAAASLCLALVAFLAVWPIVGVEAVTCRKGYYCPTSGADAGCDVPCDAGRYNPLSDQTSASACRLTSRGSWSTTGDDAEHPCAAGQYGLETGMKRPTCSGDCPAGTHCPLGTINPIVVPVGKWSATAAASAYEIPLGMECGVWREEQPWAGGCKNLKPCTAGYYCPQAEPRVRCPPGFYCPIGTAPGGQQLCPRGTYSEGGAEANCTPAPVGYYVSSTGASARIGCGGRDRYCPSEGLTMFVVVPPGDMSTGCEGEFNCQATIACPLGYYCPSGTPIQCPAGSFCPERSPAPILCAAGTFSGPGASKCTPAPAGYFIADAGAKEPAPCTQKTAYCPGTGLISPVPVQPGLLASECALPGQGACKSVRKCEAGFSCRGGEATPCTEGHACPEGTSVPAPCPPGSAAKAQQSSCTPCQPGYHQPDDTSSACIQCAPGSHQPSSNAPFCLPCPRGSATTLWGQSECQLCDVGKASLGSSLVCDPCAPGQFSNRTGNAVCQQCPKGRFASVNGSVECSACAVGMFAPAESYTTCINCDAGRFAEAEGQDYCAECAVGRFSSTGASNCTVCSPGSFTNSTASPLCLPCELGKATALPEQIACQICAPGRFAADLFSTVCESCSPGQWMPNQQSSFCFDCAVGKKSNDSGAARCDDCDAGYIAAQTGSTVCHLCSPGVHRRGTYAPTPGLGVCFPCATAVNPARTECVPNRCRPGSFSLEDGLSTCAACPLGTFSNAYSDVCHACALGQYSPQVGSPFCVPCDEGGVEGLLCVDGLASVQPGYWAYVVNVTVVVQLNQSDSSEVEAQGRNELVRRDTSPLIGSRFGALEPTSILQVQPRFRTFPCDVDSCPGAKLQFPSTAVVQTLEDIQMISMAPGNTSRFYGQVAVAEQCTPPRAQQELNYLCGQCDPAHLNWYGACVPCHTWRAGLLVAWIIALLALVLFLYLTAQSGSAVSLQSILVYFVQIAILQIGPAPAWLAWMRVALWTTDQSNNGSPASREVLVNTCFAPLTTVEQQMLSQMLLVFALAALIVLGFVHWSLAAVASCFRAAPRASALEEAEAELQVRREGFCAALVRRFPSTPPRVRRYSRAALNIYLFFYTTVFLTSMQLLSCVRVAEHGYVSRFFPHQSCADSTFTRFQSWTIAYFVIVCCAFPMALWGWVAWQRKRHHAAVAAAAVGANGRLNLSSASLDEFHDEFVRDGVLFRQPVSREAMLDLVDKHSSLAGASLLYAPFRPQVWWWMLVVLVRRGLFTICAVALANSIPGARFLSFTALSLCGVLLQVWVRPYIHDSWNRWELAAHTALVLVAATGSAYPPPYSLTPQILLTLLVGPLAVALLMATLHAKLQKLRVYRECTAAIGDRMGSLLQRCRCICFPSSSESSIVHMSEVGAAPVRLMSKAKRTSDDPADSASAVEMQPISTSGAQWPGHQQDDLETDGKLLLRMQLHSDGEQLQENPLLQPRALHLTHVHSDTSCGSSSGAPSTSVSPACMHSPEMMIVGRSADASPSVPEDAEQQQRQAFLTVPRPGKPARILPPDLTDSAAASDTALDDVILQENPLLACTPSPALDRRFADASYRRMQSSTEAATGAAEEVLPASPSSSGRRVPALSPPAAAPISSFAAGAAVDIDSDLQVNPLLAHAAADTRLRHFNDDEQQLQENPLLRQAEALRLAEMQTTGAIESRQSSSISQRPAAAVITAEETRPVADADELSSVAAAAHSLDESNPNESSTYNGISPSAVAVSPLHSAHRHPADAAVAAVAVDATSVDADVVAPASSSSSSAAAAAAAASLTQLLSRASGPSSSLASGALASQARIHGVTGQCMVCFQAVQRGTPCVR